MKKIRLFIVHQFALGYEIRIGKLRMRTVRASRIIAPLFLITGIVLATDKNPDMLQWYDIILLSLTGLSLFFGFVYFHIWPVKFEELDDYQKFQFYLHDPLECTKEQRDEVLKLMEKHPEW